VIPQPQGPRLLRPAEVARMLGVSVAWVLDHSNGRRRPNLPSVKMGKAVRFRPEDIDSFIEQHLRNAP